MDLLIDFMDADERRSTAHVSRRSVLRITLVVLPIAIALGVWHYYSTTSVLNREIERRRDALSQLQEHLQEIEARNAGFEDDFLLNRTAAGWEEAAFSWSVILSNLMVSTPANVHYRFMDVVRTRPFESEGIPLRHYTVSLRGVAVSPFADDAIKEIETFFRSGAYTSIVADVTVQAGLASDDTRQDRRFEFSVRTKQRLFYDIEP